MASDAQRASFELPFVIRGPWSDPILVPNPEGLVRRPLTVPDPPQLPVPLPN
jgi:hypothetical protein